MSVRRPWLVGGAACALLACGCATSSSSGEVTGNADATESDVAGADSEAPGDASEADGSATPEDSATDAGPAPIQPVAPLLGSFEFSPRDCLGAYDLPEEFFGPEGLGSVGWGKDELRNPYAWNLPSHFPNLWVSDNTDGQPSLRLRPWLVPDAGACYQTGVEGAVSDGAVDAAGLTRAVSPFLRRDRAFDALEETVYVPAVYPDTVTPGAVLLGLWATSNPLGPHPYVTPTDEELQQWARDLDSAASGEFGEALAELMLAVGESAFVMNNALAGADLAAWQAVHQAYLDETYFPSPSWAFATMAPVGGTAIVDTIAVADSFRVELAAAVGERVVAAARALGDAQVPSAADALREFDFPTPYGRIVLRLDATDDDNTAGLLDDAALFFDAGGADLYQGRLASTTAFFMPASVVIEAGGDDVYGANVQSLVDPDAFPKELLEPENGLTQGFGLFGIAVLLDRGGDDWYAASVHGQGAGAFGAGYLLDDAGTDHYEVALLGQGIGTFGLGILADAAGSDSYSLFALGQGLGRPGGHGLLLDTEGNDEYLALYNDDPPGLPEPGYNNVHGTTTGYSDSEGEVHHINFSRGAGVGYRGDWLDPVVNWTGGFGAFVDLGSGNDLHFADSLSVGQGFVYGFGYFYDDGGDDDYRTFWWAFGSGTHMGTGLFVEAGGNDSYLATRASATLGHDTGVSWFIDESGDDEYRGALGYGRSLDNGLAFFMDRGGDDLYELPENQQRNEGFSGFGVVHNAAANIGRVGLFFDLGGGSDAYLTARPEVMNNAQWNIAPLGENAVEELHVGVGLDK